MQLIYEGIDITDVIDIKKADLIDNAGGELDSIEVIANDPKGQWSLWKPEKNHTIQIANSGLDSGVMYIDEISQQSGITTLRALPIKQEDKTENIKGWDNVRLLDLAQEFATNHGLTLATYNVGNPLFTRLDQYGQTDFEFLAYRCLLEGYCLKLSDQRLIIYDERFMETQEPIKTLTPGDIDGDFLFKNKSTGIFSSCKITYKDIEYEYKASSTFGPTLKLYNLAVNSLGEAERFAKGLLRSKNKYEKTVVCATKLDAGIAAANTLELTDFGLADGNYFAFQTVRKFMADKTVLKLRAPLEGY